MERATHGEIGRATRPATGVAATTDPETGDPATVSWPDRWRTQRAAAARGIGCTDEPAPPLALQHRDARRAQLASSSKPHMVAIDRVRVGARTLAGGASSWLGMPPSLALAKAPLRCEARGAVREHAPEVSCSGGSPRPAWGVVGHAENGCEA